MTGTAAAQQPSRHNDSPLEDGLRILARIIAREVLKDQSPQRDDEYPTETSFEAPITPERDGAMGATAR